MRREAVAAAVVAAVAGIVVIPRLLQAVTDSMLFHPAAGQHTTPDRHGIPFEERWLDAEGTRIQAWWMPASGAGTTIVTFHGNAGTLADRIPWYRPVVRTGVAVLAVEYRGFGDSDGSPSEEGLAADGRAGIAAARALANARGDRLVVHGRSLGGAVAIRAVQEAEADGLRVDGLLVESTFTSLAEMAGRTGIPLAGRLVTYSFPSIERIGQAGSPLLLVHGTEDELIPLEMGERLVAAASAGGRPATLLRIPGGTHNDTWARGGPTYWDAVLGFFRAPGGGGR